MKTTLLVHLRDLAAVGLLLIVGARTNCAGQESPPDLSEASLEQLGNIKVYSASRHLQPSSDAPSSVTVITSNEIQQQGYRTLADILRTVPDFFVTYNRNYSSLGVRGFARPGDFNTRVLLLVDGHRLNDNVYDEAMIGTEFPIDIDLIQRIEIVRGPVSSLYGSNAVFAIINILTKQGHDISGPELSAAGGSFDTSKGRISYGRKLKQLEFMISGSFYGSRGQKQLFYPEFNTIETNNGIATNADDDQLGSAFATASFRGITLQSAYGTREKGVPTGAYGTIFNNPGIHGVAPINSRHHVIPNSFKRCFH
jgi:outer membrane cobalamin receptor